MNAENPHYAPAADLVHSHQQQVASGTYALADDALFFSHATYIDAEVRPRVLIERAVIRRAVTALLAAGYRLRLHDGEGWATDSTDSVEVVMGAIMATDEEHIRVSRDEGDSLYLGWVVLIYGNDGHDVIADHSVALADVLQDTNDFADAIAEVL